MPAEPHRARRARATGAGRRCSGSGQGLQRQPRGGNVMRAFAMLPALTGNIGRPGAGFLYLNGSDSRGVDGTGSWEPTRRCRRPAGAGQPDGSGGGLADPGSRAARWSAGTSTSLASNPQQAALRRALERDDLLTVVVDLFPTDTAAYADFVLPAASFLEFDDILAVVLPPHALGAGEGGRTAGARAAQPRDLPPAGAGDGLRRAGAAGGRCRADRSTCCADRSGVSFEELARDRHACGSTPSR